MKTLIDSINESNINEARQETYNVQLLDVKDGDGIGISATIMIDKKYSKAFEKWLEDEEGNIFGHAEGGNVEY